MASIIIREEDLTTNVLDESITDIAYVPGFGALPDSDHTTRADAFTPVLCTSLEQFESAFGSAPQKFTVKYEYNATNWGTAAFDSDNATMFDVGDADPGYTYARELIMAGLPVYYERVNVTSTIDAADMYAALLGTLDTSTSYGTDSILNKLKDRGTYRIKYITTGGYPVFENKQTKQITPEGGESQDWTIVDILLDVAAADYFEDSGVNSTGRGDCIALIDHTNYAGRALIGSGSVFNEVNGDNNILSNNSTKLSYAAMFTPWADYSVATSGVSHCALPASFAFLKCLASAIKDYANWFSIAGVARGTVKGINNILTDELLTNNIANQYQKETGISINAITRIQPYGQVIWGNRSLMNVGDEGLKATAFLNIRNMVCDIKKVLYRAARRYMFEQNSDALWINFRSMVTPLLDQMLTGQGLQAYTMTKGANSAKTKLYANITITPIYAVESFDITVQITDEDASVVESGGSYVSVA